MTLDEIWDSSDLKFIEIVKEMEFVYSTDLKGWVFEEMLDDYSMTNALREKIEKQQKKKKK